jgi:hypothetical protein
MARDRNARARIRQFLATGGPIVDSSGFATGILKERIDYSGSSVAFIQLIAAMEQKGEIVREIRGKRTYKICATAKTAKSFQAFARQSDASTTPRTDDAAGAEITIDYDLMAKALVREMWSAVAAVASNIPSDRDDTPAVMTDDYAHKLTAARQALDELFSDVESKAKATASRP